MSVEPLLVVERDDLYEWQRSGLTGGYYASKILATDYGKYTTTDDFSPVVSPDAFELPQVLHGEQDWQWRGDWKVHYDEETTDVKGWQYAVNVNSKYWYPQSFKTAYVRRRRLVRDRERMVDPRRTIRVVQWERKGNIQQQYSSAALLRTDPYPWCDMEGNKSEPCTRIKLPAIPDGIKGKGTSHQWEWSTEWKFDVDEEEFPDSGWMYGFNVLSSTFHPQDSLKMFVRKRIWIRRCELVTK